VRDLGDVIRWAGAQNAREISEFRYRVVNGREIVSFRLVPRYAIDIGARGTSRGSASAGAAPARGAAASRASARRQSAVQARGWPTAMSQPGAAAPLRARQSFAAACSPRRI